MAFAMSLKSTILIAVSFTLLALPFSQGPTSGNSVLIVNAASSPSLLFELGYRGQPIPGRTTQLVSNFTDIGSSQVEVYWLTFVVDFGGSFNQSTGLPLYLYSGEKQTLYATLYIPNGTTIGNHAISATARWRYFTTGWSEGNPITINGTIPVTTGTSNPSNPPTPQIFRLISENLALIMVGFAVYVFAVTILVALVIRRERWKQHLLTHTVLADQSRVLRVGRQT